MLSTARSTLRGPGAVAAIGLRCCLRRQNHGRTVRSSSFSFIGARFAAAAGLNGPRPGGSASLPSPLLLAVSHAERHRLTLCVRQPPSLICWSVRSSSASVDRVRGGDGGDKGRGSTRKDRITGRVLKYLRIPALVVSVYGLGYQMGSTDYASAPEERERSILNSVAMRAGCADPSRGVLMATDGDWNEMSQAEDGRLRTVVRVGRKILHVAKNLTEKEKKEVQSKVGDGSPAETLDEAKMRGLLDVPPEQATLAAAADTMKGRWSYVLLDSPAPNAFVTQMLPRKIFVTTAMMDKFVDNDDEMAIVLGHEVSHLMLGHVSDQNILQAVLSTLEVVVLTALNAAGGVGTLRAIVLLSTLRRWVGNAYSRENERAADELGIKLAAMSCFDTRRGAEVFRKMYDAQGKIPVQKILTFEATHPPTDERYNYLLKESNTENAAKYEESTCGSIRIKFRDAAKKMGSSFSK